jgi:hypothetical protein
MTPNDNRPPAPPARHAGAVGSVLQSPFCGELRSKKFYLRNKLATKADHYIDDSDHCWCFATQQVIGPDGGRVNPNRCVAGRGCYRSAFGDAER